MTKTLRYGVNTVRTPLVAKAAALFERGLRERFGVTATEGAAAEVILDVRPGAGAEGFRIAQEGSAVRIAGNDEAGLLYGVGKYLRDSRWRGASAPEKPIRAIYFATHFHNFYHDAPVAEVLRYIEDLALWGCNTLTVWFDMHHYTGIDDPAARAMIARLRIILETAHTVGMRPGLMLIANEAYASSPAELRSDWTAGHDGYFAPPGGHYHVEICPNKPGGLDLILKWRGEMLEAFKSIDLGFIVIWPYDQGGCTCSQCAPWGPNGFLKTAEPVARLLRQRFPKAALVLSTWYFDRFTTGEWEGLSKAFAVKPGWIDYLMADDFGRFPEYPLQHGIPGGLPVLSFPEISMENMWPWGAFGANPRPDHWQRYWDTVRDHLSGSFPYSEGIFEDLNKVLHLQLNWSSRRPAQEIVREYAAAEYAPEVADEVSEVIRAMEAGMLHSFNVDGLRKARELRLMPARAGDTAAVMAPGVLSDSPDWPAIYRLPKLTAPVRYAEALDRVDAKLPPAARVAWRWRILLLRARLDAELQRSSGRPTDASDACFDELGRIYHAAAAEWAVSVPSRSALRRSQAAQGWGTG